MWLKIIATLAGSVGGVLCFVGCRYTTRLQQKNIAARTLLALAINTLCILLPLFLVLSLIPRPTGLLFWNFYLLGFLVALAALATSLLLRRRYGRKNLNGDGVRS